MGKVRRCDSRCHNAAITPGTPGAGVGVAGPFTELTAPELLTERRWPRA